MKQAGFLVRLRVGEHSASPGGTGGGFTIGFMAGLGWLGRVVLSELVCRLRSRIYRLVICRYFSEKRLLLVIIIAIIRLL